MKEEFLDFSNFIIAFYGYHLWKLFICLLNLIDV